jgi:uncharacterized BrkB/YihY/UPF0761 family membrane protein
LGVDRRLQNFLAYDWDTRDFEDLEPLRPQFRGTTTRPNPVTGKQEKYYPAARRRVKQMGSGFTILTMVGLVIVIVVTILFYRLAVKASLYKSSGDAQSASTYTAITAAIINLAAIIAFSRVYQSLAGKPTDMDPTTAAWTATWTAT